MTFGIRNAILLDDVVNKAVAIRSSGLTLRRERPARFDGEYLKHVHRTLFQDCYDWAGEYRECPMGRNIDFCHPEQIPFRVTEWSARFDSGFMRVSGDAGLMADRLAVFWGELNRIHPFRDGNGRSQAAFFSIACLVKGLSASFSDRDVRNLRLARDEASDGRPRLLANLLSRSLSGDAVPYGLPPRRPSALERLKAALGRGTEKPDGPDGPDIV